MNRKPRKTNCTSKNKHKPLTNSSRTFLICMPEIFFIPVSELKNKLNNHHASWRFKIYTIHKCKSISIEKLCDKLYMKRLS